MIIGTLEPIQARIKADVAHRLREGTVWFLDNSHNALFSLNSDTKT